jgi:serine/threonine protein kinase
MEPGDVLDSRYEVKRLLGEGGMGAVYLAWDRALEKQVAVKTLLPGALTDLRARQQFKKEVRTSQELRHDSICAAYDLHENGRQPFLVMEYVEGDTLSNFIFKRPGHKCSEATLRSIAARILDAVAYAHSKGVVHRDLKSANIMVASDGSIKLMDFGIAANLKETYSRTTGSAISLSIHYASPEQINGAKPSPSMDIYSLGCIFYEMLTGEPPFTQGDILHQQLTRKPDAMEGVSAALNRVVMACLEKDPSRRPASAAEVAEMLRERAAPEPEKTVRVERSNPPPQPGAPPPPPIERPVLGLRPPAQPAAGVESPESSRGPVPSPVPGATQRGAARSILPKVLLGLAGALLVAGISWVVMWVVVMSPSGSGSAGNPVTGRYGMVFVPLSEGEFVMGCSPGDGDCEGDEKPVRRCPTRS